MSSDETIKDVPVVVHNDPTIFAVHDRKEEDGTMIVTPVIDAEYQITGMDNCIKNETRRFLSHIGSKTDAQNT
ncbi:MAG: hypothetical protein EOP04_19830 [Proteobacteria bacterium]|nr:MAG: hypothetical protein EOP04_19830 [Pseudomonadota bacterium]